MSARHTAMRRRLDRVESGVKASTPYVPPIIVWELIDPETMGIVGTFCPNTGEVTGIAAGTGLDRRASIRSGGLA